MAKTGMSPIEKLAKGLVKPVVVKQTTPPTPPVNPFMPTPTTVAPVVVKQTTTPTPPVNPFMPTPTTVAPNPAGDYIANLKKMSPEELLAKMPLIEEDLSESQRKAKAAETNYQLRLYKAQREQLEYASKLRQQGVPEERIQAILAGEGDPQKGFAKFFMPQPGGDQPILGKIAGGIGGAIKKTADVLGDIPLAGLPKVGQITLGDVGNVAKDTVSGIGKKLATGQRYFVATLDQIGEGLDAIGKTKSGDPLYYPLPPELRVKTGPFGMFRGGPEGLDSLNYKKVQSGTAGFQWSELIATAKNPDTAIGNTLWRDVTGNPYIDQAVGFLGEIFADPTNLLTFGAGGVATKSVAKVAGLSPEAYNALAKTSKALQQQGKLAIAREVAMEALEKASKAGIEDDIITAQQAVEKIAKDLAKVSRKVAGDAAPRVGGRTGSEALATELQKVRDDAQAIVDRVGSSLDAPFGAVSNEQAAVARYTVQILSPEVIAKTASQGFAAFIPDFTSALRRTTDEAASVLGVRGGVSIRNPLEVFGGPGRARYTLPGSELITNPIGKLASNTLGGIRGKVADDLLELSTPQGKDGLFPAGLAKMRVQLRSGKLSPEDAAEVTARLKLAQRFSGRRVLESKNALATLARNGFTKGAKKFLPEDLQAGARWISDAAGFATAKAAGKITSEVEAAYKAIKNIFEEFYKQAAEASARTGFNPPYRSDYFPQILSQEAKRQLRRSPKLNNKLKTEFGYDRTWFTGNFKERTLVEGKFFFGVEITEDILKKGVTELNRIARAGGFKGNFFEENVSTVLAQYANRHGDFLALQKVLGEAPEIAPKSFARLGTVGTLILKKFDARDFDKYADQFRDVLRGVTTDPAKVSRFPGIVDSARLNLLDVSRKLTRGYIDESIALVEANRILLEHAVYANIIVEGAETAFDMTTKRFADAGEIFKQGWTELEGRAPNIFASPDVKQLFLGVEKLKDVTYLSALGNMYKDMLTFAKAWYVARPGFATRNLQGNTYMMTFGAGAETANLVQGLQIFKAMQRGVKAGKSIEEIAAAVVKQGLADTELQVLEAIAYYGSAGFGRFGEVAREIGDATGRGITQLGDAKGLKIPFGKLPKVSKPIEATTRGLSRLIGAYPQKLRAGSEYLEEMTRFQLMWDGIKRGLGPEQSAARVSKYLINYSDISKLDEAGKLAFPFWMWMTRNTPLQMQLQFTSPRGPILLEKLRKANEDREETATQPKYQRDAGKFQLKTNEGFGALLDKAGVGSINPSLPAIGFGELNEFSEFMKNPQGIVSNMAPLPRALYETLRDKNLFLDKEITKYGDSPETGLWRKLEYFSRQVFGVPISTMKSFIAMVPILRRQELTQKIFEIGIDEAQSFEQAFAAAMRLLGLPFEPGIRTLEKTQEEERIARGLKKINTGLSEAEAVAERERLDKIKEDAENLPPTDINPFMPKP